LKADTELPGRRGAAPQAAAEEDKVGMDDAKPDESPLKIASEKAGW
jgi:hypothetical protein